MALVLLDRAGGTAYSPQAPLGTAALLIANDLDTYQELGNIGNGNTFYYLARHRTADEWEVGVATIQISGAFTYVVRAAAGVQDGSSGIGTLVNFSAGYVDVISVFTAAAFTSLIADVSFAGSNVNLTGSTYVSVESPNINQFVVYANVNAFDARYAQGTSVSTALATVNAQLVSVSNAIVSLAAQSATSVSNELFLYKTSINALTPVLQASISVNQAAATSVGSALFLYRTSVNALTPTLQASVSVNQAAITSINTALTSVIGTVTSANSTITSINAAVPRLSVANAFTGANSFAAPISASSASFFGPVRVSANAWTPLFQLTDGTSIAVNMGRSNKFFVTLGGNRTFEAPTNLQPGQGGAIWIVQDGTGGRTAAWNTVWKFPASVAPTLSTTSAAVDCIVFEVYTSTRVAAQAVLNV